MTSTFYIYLPAAEMEQMLRDLRKVGRGIYKDILVLLPYTAQKDRFAALVNPAFLICNGEVRVETIDSCQGSEADAVFLGLVKT